MNKNKIIFKILSNSTKNLHQYWIYLSSLIGIFLLSFAIQLYLDLSQTDNNSEFKKLKNHIIISKKVSTLNTLGNRISNFSERELSKIFSLPGVQNVGKFYSNTFEVWGTLSAGKNSRNIGTELFFESVDDEFIDDLPKKWKWNKENRIVPIILPADFLNLYNYTFAPSRNLKPISKATIKLATFDLFLKGSKGSRRYKGRIAGFSNRINSVIVPLDFLIQMNRELGGKQTITKSPSKIIVNYSMGNFSHLLTFINKNNWQINNEKIVSEKFAALAKVILGVLLIFGLLIVFISLGSSFLYLGLTLHKSRSNIESLFLIGTNKKSIIEFYIRRLVRIYTIMTILVLCSIYYTKLLLISIFSNLGLLIPSGIHMFTVFFVLILFTLFVAIQNYQLKRIPLNLAVISFLISLLCNSFA